MNNKEKRLNEQESVVANWIKLIGKTWKENMY